MISFYFVRGDKGAPGNLLCVFTKYLIGEVLNIIFYVLHVSACVYKKMRVDIRLKAMAKSGIFFARGEADQFFTVVARQVSIANCLQLSLTNIFV